MKNKHSTKEKAYTLEVSKNSGLDNSLVNIVQSVVFLVVKIN